MVAICFYTPETYEELKRVADDKTSLCDTYTDWLVEFSKAMTGFNQLKLEVVPVSINIEELCEWCKENKLKNITANRSRYVAEITKSEYSQFTR